MKILKYPLQIFITYTISTFIFSNMFAYLIDPLFEWEGGVPHSAFLIGALMTGVFMAGDFLYKFKKEFPDLPYETFNIYPKESLILPYKVDKSFQLCLEKLQSSEYIALNKNFDSKAIYVQTLWQKKLSILVILNFESIDDKQTRITIRSNIKPKLPWQKYSIFSIEFFNPGASTKTNIEIRDCLQTINSPLTSHLLTPTSSP